MCGKIISISTDKSYIPHAYGEREGRGEEPFFRVSEWELSCGKKDGPAYRL